MADINKIIHEPARLKILTYLMKNEDRIASFSELKDALNISSGNLSVQINKLSEKKYIKIEKTFKNNRPHTAITVTYEGLNALRAYFDEMEAMITKFKKNLDS
ncbi:MAG: helix-turn-helix domain-containing protein [Desulfobacteraceae bacterium]|nr:helix-turn-helix domain-containing protein [Desulfobacteraceae bacterium]